MSLQDRSEQLKSSTFTVTGAKNGFAEENELKEKDRLEKRQNYGALKR